MEMGAEKWGAGVCMPGGRRGGADGRMDGNKLLKEGLVNWVW